MQAFERIKRDFQELTFMRRNLTPGIPHLPYLKTCPESIQFPMPNITKFSVGEMDPEGMFHPPPTQAQVNSRLSR
ncbi:hypothetical protein [Marinovum sp.]|uniref:hypothetical protein n=1 Tax=Marinovum sp. TaxID=2024839 RepID=UPI003A5C8870